MIMEKNMSSGNGLIEKFHSTSQKRSPHVKREITRTRLNKFDEFIAGTCEDIYRDLVDDSKVRSKDILY